MLIKLLFTLIKTMPKLIDPAVREASAENPTAGI
jgi:hypothetical protein